MRYLTRVDQRIVAAPEKAETSAARQFTTGIVLLVIGALTLSMAQQWWSIMLGVGCVVLGLSCLYAGCLLTRLWWRSQTAFWNAARGKE